MNAPRPRRAEGGVLRCDPAVVGERELKQPEQEEEEQRNDDRGLNGCLAALPAGAVKHGTMLAYPRTVPTSVNWPPLTASAASRYLRLAQRVVRKGAPHGWQQWQA